MTFCILLFQSIRSILLLVYIRLLEYIGYLCVFKNIYIQGFSLYFREKQNSKKEERRRKKEQNYLARCKSKFNSNIIFNL